MNDTINVPRELLKSICKRMNDMMQVDMVDKISALLQAQSQPAADCGLEVVGYIEYRKSGVSISLDYGDEPLIRKSDANARDAMRLERIAQLEAQLVGYDKLGRDANRYRWFRWSASESFYGDEIIRLVNDPVSLDSAIDARLNGAAPKPDQQEPRHTHAEPVQEPVAYLDIGIGGYVDLGSDKPIEELEKLPMGRHMLEIIGTYGVDGYTAAPKPSDDVAMLRKQLDEEHVRELAVHIKCETTDENVIGTTSSNVVRIEHNDDGSITAVTDHWPASTTAPQPSGYVASEPDVQSELNEKRENICRLLIELDKANAS